MNVSTSSINNDGSHYNDDYQYMNNALDDKEKFIEKLVGHSLKEILKNGLRPELYNIFMYKYGVVTFE